MKDKFMACGAIYLKGQLEKGESGTPHYQFFVSFTNKKSLKQLQQIIPNVHYTISVQPVDAINYVSKEETRVEGPWEFGQKPQFKGNKEVKEKIPLKELLESPLETLVEEEKVNGVLQYNQLVKA